MQSFWALGGYIVMISIGRDISHFFVKYEVIFLLWCRVVGGGESTTFLVRHVLHRHLSGTKFPFSSSHAKTTRTRRSSCASVSAARWSTRCHVRAQRRQHVAVACCAIKTGCPRHGVCLPSSTRKTRRRFASISRACARSVARGVVAKIRRSTGPR